LVLLHPEVASRSCEDCQRFLYLDKGFGQFGAEPITRGGQPVRRVPGQKTPCVWCPKIPPGDAPKPENAADLTPENWAALRHHRECEAVKDFPSDAIVRRNAVLIADADKAAAAVHQTRTGLAMLSRLKGL
jgi:hypothetical protein